jgi:hypothetical protein
LPFSADKRRKEKPGSLHPYKDRQINRLLPKAFIQRMKNPRRHLPFLSSAITVKCLSGKRNGALCNRVVLHHDLSSERSLRAGLAPLSKIFSCTNAE